MDDGSWVGRMRIQKHQRPQGRDVHPQSAGVKCGSLKEDCKTAGASKASSTLFEVNIFKIDLLVWILDTNTSSNDSLHQYPLSVSITINRNIEKYVPRLRL